MTIAGEASVWQRTADGGHVATYRFCPRCGSTVAYVIEGWPGVIAVPIGAFADPDFPPPRFSGYENRKHPWTVVLGDEVEHSVEPSARRRPFDMLRSVAPAAPCGPCGPAAMVRSARVWRNGRRRALKMLRRKAWEFNSPHPHHLIRSMN